MYNCILLIFSICLQGTRMGHPRTLSKVYFYLPLNLSFTYKDRDMCSRLLFKYLKIYVPFSVHINENESMNAQCVLSPLSLSFSLVFSSPLSTAIAVLILLQIPLQPFSSTHSIMGSLYIYIYIYIYISYYFWYFIMFVCLTHSL